MHFYYGDTSVIMSFSQKVLQWFDAHGRKNLPWQKNINPYRVWISEVMLQQTQVMRVIPYFENFITYFPTVIELATADQDDVLHLWSGLGYYNRARNLHKAARIIKNKFNGALPQSVKKLTDLPGISLSTAGAIASISMGIRTPILDSNVKRVLARYKAVSGLLGKADTEKQLWQISEECTPYERISDYTQVMMDLGAMICTKTNPSCMLCPLQNDCKAHCSGQETLYPQFRPKKDKPEKFIKMLMVLNQYDEVLLEKRPSAGIWGGLWSFPEIPVDEELSAVSKNKTGLTLLVFEEWTTFRHTFSHYHLQITPIKTFTNSKNLTTVADDKIWKWFQPDQPAKFGLAAPVSRLLDKIQRSLKISA